jgi:hypothetical protein
MLVALIAGERNPAVLAEHARARMRPKIPVLIDALTGRFTGHHAAGHRASRCVNYRVRCRSAVYRRGCTSCTNQRDRH